MRNSVAFHFLMPYSDIKNETATEFDIRPIKKISDNTSIVTGHNSTQLLQVGANLQWVFKSLMARTIRL